MRELDTITDFVAYLRAKEAFLGRAHIFLEGREWDLLAIYLREGRKFPEETRAMVLSDGLWNQVRAEPDFKRRKVADEVSYAWDNLIEELAGHVVAGTILGSAPQEHTEVGLRYMARESRFHRRLLGGEFVDFMGAAEAGKTRSRRIQSPTGVVYVFVVCGRSWAADTRGYELRAYCSILLDEHPDAPAVVGVMTEKPDGDWRLSFAMMVFEAPVTDEIRGYAADARKAGILQRRVLHESHVKEYPDE